MVGAILELWLSHLYHCSFNTVGTICLSVGDRQGVGHKTGNLISNGKNLQHQDVLLIVGVTSFWLPRQQIGYKL